jgi:Putative stress-induced transcription regulator
MDERDKRRVGEQVEPGRRPKAPGRLELLQRFINSYNHDLPRDWDRLATPQKAQDWLRQKGLVGLETPVSAQDTARLRELREAMRALVIANQARRPDTAPGAAPVGVMRAAVRVRLLRPLQEPLGGLVCHVDLRQPRQEPRLLPAAPCRCQMSQADAASVALQQLHPS